MKPLYPLLFFICLYPAAIFAQVDSTNNQADSLRKDSLRHRPHVIKIKDSTRIADSDIFQPESLKIKDSLRIRDSLRLVQQTSDSLQKKLVEKQLPVQILKEGDKKIFLGKEYLFYYLIFLLILFGLLRGAFAKYFYDLFRVFFKTTLKQRQAQEQLLQSALASVFMNSFFVLSAGLYVNFLLQYFQLVISDNFWLQYVYCAGALAAIYLVKYIGLKITGWLFNVSNATDSYIFIVFIINKMLGIFLLPFLLLLAFATDPLYSSAMFISWVGIGLLLIYRFILSYGAVRKEVKLNSFHFILYILGFEVVPLLLIYKLLLLIF
ncbi:MAG TPA: DUF4271 domain-containing protein [Chitinophagaceae bacterium]|nr:DUF4271 domain-containing protein [Chitinophagaceae bacterium]